MAGGASYIFVVTQGNRRIFTFGDENRLLYRFIHIVSAHLEPWEVMQDEASLQILNGTFAV